MVDEIPFKEGCVACEGKLPDFEGTTNYCSPHFDRMKAYVDGMAEAFVDPRTQREG